VHSTLYDVLCAYSPVALTVVKIIEVVVKFYFSKDK